MLHLVKLRFKEVERLRESPRGRDDKAKTGFKVLQLPSLLSSGCLPERIEPSRLLHELLCLQKSSCLLAPHEVPNQQLGTIPIGHVARTKITEEGGPSLHDSGL